MSNCWINQSLRSNSMYIYNNDLFRISILDCRSFTDQCDLNFTSDENLKKLSWKGGINHTGYWDRTDNRTFKLMAVSNNENKSQNKVKHDPLIPKAFFKEMH